ncbi:MAG: UvrD-helicase domain-containing protein, partial [Rickettsiales bacterium]|nr:UvrD-helicase domain-containing protein [Rickettsiales bacterium]
MAPTLTQQRAANPQHSAWVTANAGTGKTKVLIDRLLQIMLTGTPPENILCLTFTKAAAAEMVSRVQHLLLEWTVCSDTELQNHLQTLTGNVPDTETFLRARRLFTDVIDCGNRLNIQTIHAFCQSLLRRFPLEASLNPHFQVMDDQTSAELVRESWMRLFTCLDYEVAIPTNLDMDSASVKTALTTLTTHCYEESLYKAVQSLIGDRYALHQLQQQYDGDEALIAHIHATLGVRPEISDTAIIQEFMDQNHTALLTLADALDAHGNHLAKDRSRTIMSTLGKNSRTAFNRLASVFLTKENAPKQLQNIAAKKVVEQSPGLETSVETLQQRVHDCQETLFALHIARMTGCFLTVADSVLALYRYLKTEKGLLDYDDLIIATHDLLKGDGNTLWVMYKLDYTIDHILVDEAQDTSPQQWDIITSLCKEFFSGDSGRNIERTLFVVGDEKQSIFSFQGADLATFNLKKHMLEKDAGTAGKSWLTLSLDESFRSVAPVLELVDTVFSDPELHMAVTEENSVGHDVFRTDEPGKVELWPMITLEEKQESPEWPLPEAYITPDKPRHQLAAHIADTIRQWLDEQRILPAKNRPVNPGDIMILVRQRTDFMHTMVHALEERHIPVAGVDRLVITDHIIVKDLIALGDFLLLPTDDLTLATLLKSPLFNLNDDDLIALAHNRGPTSLWQRLLEQRDTSLPFQYAATQLESWLNESRYYLSPTALYTHVLETSGGRKGFLTRMGEPVRILLDEFLSLCYQYESLHTPTLQDFIQWIKSGSVTIKRELAHSSGMVRIMTVHGAKGLQAPIVFLPDTTQCPRKNPPDF